MFKIMKKSLLKISLIAFCAAAITGANAMAAIAEDEVDKKYQEAYSKILEEDWESAVRLFEQIIKEYPSSSWVDDSRFWRCYAGEKVNKDLEAAFKCYEQFAEQYEDSKWNDDAYTNMLKIARELAEQGKKEYAVKVREMENSADEEVKLAALWALQSRGDEKAYQAVADLYETADSYKLKKKIIYVLGTFDNRESLDKLMYIAENDTNIDIRSNAIFWLGQRGPAEEIAPKLKQLMKDESEPKILKKIIFSLSQMRAEVSDPILMKIIKENKDPEVRADAIFWIGQNSDSEEVIALLEDLAINDTQEKVRKKALFSLSQLKDNKGAPSLLKIAKNAKDTEIREDAIFWLGQNAESESVREALKNFALNDPEEKIQKKALFSISQFPNDQGINFLQKIAKTHKNPDMRAKAIFWLGQSDKPENVLSFLKDMVKKDPEPKVQEKALFALSQLNDNAGVPALIEVAEDHPSLRMRKKAVFWLGQSDDEKARSAIETILFKNDNE